MKNILTLLTILFAFNINVNAQDWKQTGALAASNPNWYLIGATNVGNDIFAINADQTMVFSSSLGETWSTPLASKFNGSYNTIFGIKNRLYASVKLKNNNNEHELFYSIDKGDTWKLDTVGLPVNLYKTGKSAMLLKYMENDYVLAHNYTSAVYKKVDETSWKPTEIDHTIVDVAATEDKWLVIGPEKILQSTNNGGSWTQLSTSGLPARFQGNKICTNGKRIYISNAPKDGGQDIYYSDDGGSNWILTNSAGKFTHANPWVQNLYAVDDYVFAAIMPISFNKPPPYIYSVSTQPDFAIGDFSVYIGLTNTNLPFFFHVKNKLFTMMGDLYSSEPGFKGNLNPTSVIGLAKHEKPSVMVYPNPASQSIQIKSENIDISCIEINDMNGQNVFHQNIPQFHSVNISDWMNGFYIVKTTSANGQTFQTKFIKK